MPSNMVKSFVGRERGLLALRWRRVEISSKSHLVIIICHVIDVDTLSYEFFTSACAEVTISILKEQPLKISRMRAGA